ncbi:MAG TPA: PASTA domain-containing protein, partial [Chthoniobacterales bacterium]|nr:PASTA domain-containing protein [Chthoniobacterales bacterium]
MIDPLGDPLPGVTVSWSSVTGEEDLFGGRTNASGEHEFSSMHAPYLEVTTLRKGLKVKVTRPGFIERDYTIGADQLQPSTQPRRVSVQMDKDWSELEKAIAALEARVSAWRNDASRARAKLQSFEQLVSKLVAAPGRVAAIVQELKNAEKAFNAKLSSTTCAQAMELKNTVLSLHGQANQKGQEFDAAMKEANALGEACSTQAQAEKIMASYKTGIRLVGEIGALGKKAQEANEKLGRFAEAMREGAALQTQLQQTSAAIETEISDAQKDEETASSNYQDAYYASKSLPGTRAALAAEVQKLKNDADLKKYASKAKTLVKRIDALEESLGSVNNDVSFARAPDPKRLEVIDQTRNKLHDYKKEADGILSGFKAALCDAQPQDSAIEEIRTRVTNASFDIGLAADLPAKAKACETRVAAAASPTPAPGDEVVVPDLSVFGGLSEMKAVASHAGLVPAVAATKATPPPGTTRMFAGQEPAANTKVKKGSALKILVYQQMAQASPSPSPSATAIAQTSPSPPADEVRVPDLSVFDGVGEMKAAASHVGLVPALAATKATPPPGATRLFAGQEPAAGSKAKRGSTLKILVYQQAATAAAAPTPSGSPSDNAVAASGKMPDLTGLTLEQAMTRLTSNMRIGGDEVGDKPPAPEKAMTIFAQTPAAGSNLDTKKNVVVTVKRYGSSKSAEEATPPPFEEQPTGAVS